MIILYPEKKKLWYDTHNCKGCAPAACYNRVWKKVDQRWEKEAVLFLLRYNHMIRFPNDCIWGTGKSKGQVFIHVQSDFPFILYTFFNFFYHILTVWLSSDCWMEIGLQSTGPLREFLGPREKGNLPPPPILQIMILKLSPPRYMS